MVEIGINGKDWSQWHRLGSVNGIGINGRDFD